MDIDDVTVALLHQGPHPAHRGFAEAIDAEFVDFHGLDLGILDDTLAEDVIAGVTYPDYDVYLVEGSRPLWAGLTRRFTRGGRLVYLAADHGFYEFGSRDFRGDSTLKSVAGRFGSPLAKVVGRRGIDGVIAVSEFVAEFTRPFVGPTTPVEVAHPFIRSGTFERLGGINPNLGSNTAVTVARPWHYKGVDLLVEAWPIVRNSFPSAELHIVGSGHPEKYGENPGVSVRGYVDDLGKAFEPGSLFVQPSRVDAFPVSTLEAMRAGLPAMVTETTGTRSEVYEVDDTLVVEPNADALAEGIKTYFSRPLSERNILGARARRRAERFDPESRKAAFQAAFRAILKAL